MSTDPKSNPTWEDVVFENRNKDYGAYIIRKIYSKNLGYATAGTLVILLLTLAAPAIAALLKSDDVVEKKELTKVVTLDQPPPIDPNVPPPPKVEVPPPVKTLKYVAPKVVKEEVVEEEIPTIEEIKKVEVSTTTQEGPETVVYEEPVKAVVSEGEDNSIHQFAEQQPAFAGGVEAMTKFIQKNLKYPNDAKRMNQEGKVFVQFVVNKDGSISDVETIKGIWASCDKEAARVVSIMPQWIPGKQNGKAVRVKYVVPIFFRLSN